MKYITLILAIALSLVAIKLNQTKAELESAIHLKELAQSSANYYYNQLSSN